MSWVYAFTRVLSFIGLGIITFVLCLHAMYSWGLTTSELSYLAMLLVGIGAAGTFLPRRHKTPDIKLPPNAHVMNRTGRDERVFSQEQWEQILRAQNEGKERP